MRVLYFDGSRVFLDHHYPAPEPRKNEALLKILLAGICDTDLQIVAGYMQYKGILGHEFVARVERAQDSTWLGQTVVGEINISCGSCEQCRTGLGNHCSHRSVLGILNKDGILAEYATLPLSNLRIVPPSLAPQQAVFCEPLAAAVQISNQIQIQPTARVLLLGDGKLGSLIAQTLALTGCDLTVLGRHPAKLNDLLKHTANITVQTELSSRYDRTFDVVVEATGRSQGLQLACRYVKPRGTVIMKSTLSHRDNIDLNKVVIDEITIIGSRCGPFSAALRLLESRKVQTDFLIEAIMPLSQGEEAFQQASKRGSKKILIDPTR
ncbi:alcohol dehydrogenase catalytic domain-containing protein [candidate division CSSED10-310 bacterium]|uniref:Alcohol dehydrogenase catalytic domain-containing protein n=1 Tax=candidate division CSSED10-310 bacterium TaxID=2855610 RepID=A0ABV6YXT9_UNCC1